MKSDDLDRLSREYASEEFDPKDPGYWIAKSAFLAAHKAASAKEPKGRRILRIDFIFPKRTVEVTIKDVLRIEKVHKFEEKLRKITKAIKVKAYGSEDLRNIKITGKEKRTNEDILRRIQGLSVSDPDE